MLLSATPLNDVQSVNSFRFTPQIVVTQGDTANLYFQLIDASQNTAMKGFNPPGLRFMPAVGATLLGSLTNIDDALAINARNCTQPFPTSDPSIWYLPLLASDLIVGSCDLVLTLIQNGVVTNGRVPAAVLIQSVTGCLC